MRRPHIDDEITVLRLPRPPKPARIDLYEAESPESDGVRTHSKTEVGAWQQVTSNHLVVELPVRRPEPAHQRPSLEALLMRAESLANTLTVSDPRGRLLQVALLRRDHTLIEAIVMAHTESEPIRHHRTLASGTKRHPSRRITVPCGPHRRRAT